MSRSHRHGVKLVKLADGRQVARFRDPITGKQKQQSLDLLGLTNAKQRERWAREKAEALRVQRAKIAATHGSGLPTEISIRDAQVQYLELFESSNTRKAKTSALGPAADYLEGLGVRTVVELSRPMLASFGDHIRRPGNPLKVSTRNAYLSAVAAWLRWCDRRGFLGPLTESDVARALYRQQGVQEAIDVLQPGDVQQLLRACIAHDSENRRKWAPFVLFVLLSGMRLHEAVGFEWSGYDERARCIRLSASETKTRRHRVITMEETPALEQLLQTLRFRGGRGRVFPDVTMSKAKDWRPTGLQRYEAPVGWTWRHLRRTCGSLLVCGGIYGNAGTFLTAKRLGHGLAVAERHYLDALVGLPKNCETVEQAGGFEREAVAIVRVAGMEEDQPLRERFA